ncbi:MAG: hypothetical protein QM757_22945 [Paludibaculum sp.]
MKFLCADWRYFRFLLCGAAVAQKQDPIQWTAAAAKSGDTTIVQLTARAEEGWHVYSMTTPRPPIATTAKIDEAVGENVEVFQPPTGQEVRLKLGRGDGDV